jgi:hypothetical protein
MHACICAVCRPVQDRQIGYSDSEAGRQGGHDVPHFFCDRIDRIFSFQFSNILL